MFTFSKATSNTQPRPSLRFRTFNGWTSTVERMCSHAVPPTKPRQGIFWLRRGANNSHVQSVERTNSKKSVSPPFRRNCTPFPLMVPPTFSRPADVVEATAPVYDVGAKDYPGLETFCSTKVVLIASTEASRPCRIRRVNTRKELPWIPISKPLPPLPSSPSPIADSKIQPVADASYLSTISPSPPARPYPATPRNSLEDILDDGLDDLSLFLRRIAYDAISASTIHRHLGFMEDGGRVLPLGRTTRSVYRSISPPKRFSSLIGVSLAIMEGRLPKALMAT